MILDYMMLMGGIICELYIGKILEGNYHGLLEVLRKTMQDLSSDGQGSDRDLI